MTAYPRSARELLTDYGLNEGTIDGILDIHAHELAERIRAQRGTTTLESGHHFFNGMDFAAELIDPKAQRAAPAGDNA